MAPYIFYPTLLLRTPVYSHHFYNKKNLIDLLKQPFFQKAIYFVSEALYDELKKSNFDLEKLDKKAVYSLNKYFNRMCFRPTPFGICAAFGVVQWGKSSVIKFSNKNLQPQLQLSYAKTIQQADAILTNYTGELIYKFNSSIYKNYNEYRFIKSNRDNTQLEFVIDSIKANPFLKKLIQHFNESFTYKQLHSFICSQTACSVTEANNYIEWLIDNQIINHTLEPNITGDDYLTRLLPSTANHTKNEVPNKVTQLIQIDNVQDIPECTDNLKTTELYVNLHVKMPQSELSETYQQHITDGIKCLNILSTDKQHDSLTDFIKKFIEKFDGQTVPLLTALDPEIGVGYGNLAVEQDDVNIVKNIIYTPTTHTKTIQWSDVHTLFFNKWKNQLSNNAIIITDDDLKHIKQNNNPTTTGISVMFRIVNGKVLIENAGGSCASSLIGRFTPFNDDIHQMACDMAAEEAQNNPDIIFAEIAHICHNHTANIDRRKHIYQYEIPVLVQSTMPAERQILLSDLWVSVLNGKIILQSKKHGKRIVPRLSSAFNYTRNDLAVFRFLCDMQHAEVITNFSLNLNQFFPGLSFYPRVEYQNTILHLAYWNLNKDIFEAVIKDKTNKIALFSEVKKQLSLPQYIALTQHDNQLVFNLDDEADVLFFLDNIKTQQQFTIKEYLLPLNNEPIVTNDNNQPHVNQFIALLYHKQQVYEPTITPVSAITKQNRIFIPGSEWLYIKLYCHPVRSNEVLSVAVNGILKKLWQNKLINQWFFIRYQDPDYHIRLRLKVEEQKHQEVLNVLHKFIYHYTTNNTISNYTINTYNRELERYGYKFIPWFEDIFFCSSNLVLMFLRQKNAHHSDEDILSFCLVSVNDIVMSLGFTENGAVNFYEQMFTSFAGEFNSITDLKYQLDTQYRKQKKLIETVMRFDVKYYNNNKLNKARMVFIDSLKKLKDVVDKKTWRKKWVADIIHMHLNRIFTNDSRKQEMAIYYFMLKYQRSEQARLVAKS